MDDAFMLSDHNNNDALFSFPVPPPTPVHYTSDEDAIQNHDHGSSSMDLLRPPETFANRLSTRSSTSLRRSHSHGSAPALSSGRKNLVVRGRSGSGGRRSNQHMRRQSGSGLSQLSLTAINEAFVPNAKDPMLSPLDDDPTSPTQAHYGNEKLSRLISFSSGDVSLLQQNGIGSLDGFLGSSASIYENGLESVDEGPDFGMGMDTFVGDSFVATLEAATSSSARNGSYAASNTLENGDAFEPNLLNDLQRNHHFHTLDDQYNSYGLPPSPTSTSSSQHVPAPQQLLLAAYPTSSINGTMAYSMEPLAILPNGQAIPASAYATYAAAGMIDPTTHMLQEPPTTPLTVVSPLSTPSARATPYNISHPSRSRTRSVPTIRLNQIQARANGPMYPSSPLSPTTTTTQSPPSPLSPTGAYDYANGMYSIGTDTTSLPTIPTSLLTTTSDPDFTQQPTLTTTSLHGRLRRGRHSTSSLNNNYTTYSQPQSTRSTLPRSRSSRRSQSHSSSPGSSTSTLSTPHIKIDDLVKEQELLVAQIAEAQAVRMKEDQESSQMIETLGRLMGMHGISS